MNVATAIDLLQKIRENPDYHVPLNEFEAIGIAIVVLASLEPSSSKLIDALLTSSDYPPRLS